MWRAVAAVALTVWLGGCVPRGAVAGGTPADGPVNGTIAGTVRTSGEAISLSARMVTAINVETGRRHEVTTATNGGYTIEVPPGTYRLEVELRDGEAIEKAPEPTAVNPSDVDADRDFIVAVKR